MQQVHRKVPSCECEHFSFWKFQRRRSVEMAKPKNEDHKPENSDDAIVQHQKLCLAIDMDNRRIYGYTELKEVIPESGHVGLHADNMTIEAITVDGEAAEFELFPHYQFVDDESRWSSVSSATSASQAASSSLEMEMASNLQILCKSGMMGHQQQTDAPNNSHTSTELKQNVRLIRIDSLIQNPETGIRRAHCWFPCMESSSQRCCYDLEFMVAQNLVVVTNGTLLYQNLCFHTGWISLAVAPFEVFSDRHSVVVSHMCLSANLSKLRHTVTFFHSAFSHYEDYLASTFPFGSYKQVFIAPEIAISSSTLGASMSIFSCQVLFDEKVIDQANFAVCKADVSGATALSSSASCKDLYGTQCIGIYGKIRSWKSVAVLQMLERQIGPESFRKFRHFSNKVGNLERPFLKEFFSRWVGASGCPVLRTGFSYNKRKNMIEMAVWRGCTVTPGSVLVVPNGNPTESREADVGWPGMMSIRVYELDGMYDHPILPMAGEAWQLIEIQCHSKLAARRIQKPMKGTKPDGSDDNCDTPTTDMLPSVESPLLWLRTNPEMEYLAEIHFNEPFQMWRKTKMLLLRHKLLQHLKHYHIFHFQL